MTELPPKSAIVAWMVLPLRRYARFSGRSGAREFWLYSLFLVLGYLAVFCLTIIAALIWEDSADDLIVWLMIGGSTLFFIATFVPGVALTVRRLHDFDLSGWVLLVLFALVLFLNMFGWLGYLVAMSMPGKTAANRHGPPVGDENTAEIFA